MSTLKRKVFKGFIWSLLERFSVQGVSFLVSIVLSRLLTPNDYGSIALLAIFISLSQVIVNGGFGSALIQKKNVSEEDFSSVFYLSLSISFVVYGVLFYIAPLVASFYNIVEISALLRFVGITVIFNSISNVQMAVISRNFLFNLSFRISIISTITSAIVGITLAFLEYGSWALAWSTVVASIVSVVSQWCFVNWHPQLIFSWKSIKCLFSYGWKLTMTSLISVCSNNFSGVLIGRLYSSKDLAFVNRGKGLPQLVMDSINETLGRVAFPALSQLQDRRDIQREVVRKMISVSTFFVFPLMACVAVCAHNLVLFLFGDQWIPIVPYLQVSCFSFALWPLHTINLQAINSIGRSGLLLKLEIVKRILGLIVIIMSIKFGVFWMVAAEAFIFGPLGVIINSWPNRKLLNYTLEMQLRDVLPAALISGVVAIPVVALNFIPIHSQLARFGLLSAQCVVTVVLFVGLSFYFRLRGLREIGEIAKGRILAKFPRLLPLFSYLEK